MRSMWNGSISFGLITIPVKMYSASEERSLDLDMLDKHDHARIRYKRVNEDTGDEVEWNDIVKGFKLNDHYIILDKEDFEQANMKKSKTIDIEEFVEEEEVENILFKKPYFLEPQKESGKAYNLLRDALKKTKKVGVATFVMRQKENLSLIGVYKNVIMLHVIRFAEELRDPSDLKLPETKVSDKEVEMALSLIEQYTEEFDLEKYKDVYNDQLMEIIEAKSAGVKPKAEKVKSEATDAKDLMKQLQASLKQKKNGKGNGQKKSTQKKSKAKA
ncbi:MAG: Ku protein [Balneolaceae bacterium]